MEINLKDEWYLISDENEYAIAQKLYKNKEDTSLGTYFKRVGHFSSITGALKSFISKEIRTKQDIKTWDSLYAVMDEYDKLIESILRENFGD
jgi:hypothetical protein